MFENAGLGMPILWDQYRQFPSCLPANCSCGFSRALSWSAKNGELLHNTRACPRTSTCWERTPRIFRERFRIIFRLTASIYRRRKRQAKLQAPGYGHNASYRGLQLLDEVPFHSFHPLPGHRIAFGPYRESRLPAVIGRNRKPKYPQLLKLLRFMAVESLIQRGHAPMKAHVEEHSGLNCVG